jgi:hypothetical protein
LFQIEAAKVGVERKGFVIDLRLHPALSPATASSLYIGIGRCSVRCFDTARAPTFFTTLAHSRPRCILL